MIEVKNNASNIFSTTQTINIKHFFNVFLLKQNVAASLTGSLNCYEEQNSFRHEQNTENVFINSWCERSFVISVLVGGSHY